MSTIKPLPITSVPFSESELPPIDERPVLLFVGIEAPVFSSQFMVKGFEKAGYNVKFLDWQKIKINEGVEMLQSMMVAKALKDEADLIFLHIQNDNILNSVIVAKLQEIAPTVIYNFDCREKDKMKWLYDLVPYVELVCFSNIEDVQECAKLGYHNTAVLKSSADYDHYQKLPNVSDEDKKEFHHEIVFIGNKFDTSNLSFPKAQERTEMVEFLQKEYGDRFKAWGIGYSRMVNPQEERIIYSTAKIAITHNNFYRTYYCSDRTWRAMGNGVLTIQKHYPEMNKDFTPAVSSVWLNFDMLKQEIDKHLENDLLREVKAKAGAEFVREKHTWYHRVLELQELLKLMKARKTEL